MKFELYPPSTNQGTTTLTSQSTLNGHAIPPPTGNMRSNISGVAATNSNGAASLLATVNQSTPATTTEEEIEHLSSDGSSKGLPMPIDKLKVLGNQLNQQKMSPPQSPHPPSTAATLRRYEFIRRSLPRSEKQMSPTFVIEGRKVMQKQNGETVDAFEETFDPFAYLDRGMKSSKSLLPPKPKADPVPSVKSSATSVVLPVLHIEGPGFSHQVRSKSSSLPGDDQPAEMEDVTTTDHPVQPESIMSELENIDQKNHRAIKKNNFFTNTGTRMGDDHSELCVENASKGSKTITLHLQTSQEKKRPATHGFVAVPSTNGSGHHLPKTSKSSRDKLYNSANQLTNGVATKPVFHSVSSYINFNRRAGLYTSEQYLDSTKMDGPLKPLDNFARRPVNKKLIAKYSDMEIQKELNDFFKVRPVK